MKSRVFPYVEIRVTFYCKNPAEFYRRITVNHVGKHFADYHLQYQHKHIYFYRLECKDHARSITHRHTHTHTHYSEVSLSCLMTELNTSIMSMRQNVKHSIVHDCNRENYSLNDPRHYAENAAKHCCHVHLPMVAVQHCAVETLMFVALKVRCSIKATGSLVAIDTHTDGSRAST